MRRSEVNADIKRTEETNRKYISFLKSGKKPKWKILKEYPSWQIIENKFPYDKVAKKHTLLFPKRKFRHDAEMTFAERMILRYIKEEASEEYDSILENFIGARSVPDHFHYHLIKWKEK